MKTFMVVFRDGSVAIIWSHNWSWFTKVLAKAPLVIDQIFTVVPLDQFPPGR